MRVSGAGELENREVKKAPPKITDTITEGASNSSIKF